jgi:hypothetical protein
MCIPVTAAWRILGLRLEETASSGKPTGGGSSAWWLAEELTNPRHKKTSLLRTVTQDLGIEGVLVNTVMNLRVT